MTSSLTDWMNSLLSTAPALRQASVPSIGVADCKVWLQIPPIRCTLLRNVTLPCFLSRDGGYFPILWICAGLVNCFDQWNEEEITLYDFQGKALRDLAVSTSTLLQRRTLLMLRRNQGRKTMLREVYLFQVAQPPISPPTDWAQIKCAEELFSQSTESLEIVNPCFKPLDLGALLLHSNR